MREFVQTSRQFICGDRFIHSHDLYVCSGSVTVWRNRMLVTIGARGGTLGISGWGCAAGSLEPLTFTRASSAEFCHPKLE